MSGINIYESGIPIDQAKDLAAQARASELLGLVKGLCREEVAGLG